MTTRSRRDLTQAERRALWRAMVGRVLAFEGRTWDAAAPAWTHDTFIVPRGVIRSLVKKGFLRHGALELPEQEKRFGDRPAVDPWFVLTEAGAAAVRHDEAKHPFALYRGSGAARTAVVTNGPSGPEVWATIGLPCSGKTTFAAAVPGAIVLSIDAIRAEHGLEFAEPEETIQAYDILRERGADALSAGRPVVVDATGTLRRFRQIPLDLGVKFGVPVRALILATPPAVCHERECAMHPDRDRSFAYRFVVWMDAALHLLRDERFASVHRVSPARSRALLKHWKKS